MIDEHGSSPNSVGEKKGSERLCRKLINSSPASVFCIVVEGDEHDEQIAAGCVGHGLADRQAEAAVVHACE